MSYSPSGNIVSKSMDALTFQSGIGDVLVNYDNSYDYNHPQPHAISQITDNGVEQNFSWDLNGNMIQHTRTEPELARQLCWDEENRLTAVRDQNHLSTYIYDGGGERVWKLTGQVQQMYIGGQGYVDFVDLNNKTLYASAYLVYNEQGYSKHYYAGAERVSSRIGGGMQDALVNPLTFHLDHLSEHDNFAGIANDLWEMTVRSILCTDFNPENVSMEPHLHSVEHSQNIDDPEDNRYIYHSDHLGSSAFLTDASGTPTQHLQYLPFGETFIEQRSITSYYTPYTFSAKERDLETGYSFFGARYYDADISIWLSVDPMADKTPGLTPYRYCFQNPINNTDVTGLLEDGYTVDEWGNFERVDKTGGKTFDVIFNKAAYQAGKKEYDETGTKSGIKIEKSILKSHKKISIMIFDRDGHDTGVRRTNDRYEVNSDKKATNLFEFLANNTKVEWSNTYLINPETGKTINSLCTSHEEGTISGGTNVIYKYTDQGYLVKRMDHNHPSGSSKASSDDKESASLYHSTPDVKFRVYAKKHYYPYSPQK